MRRIVTIALAALVIVAAAGVVSSQSDVYVVFLKNGSRIEAVSPPEIQGDNAIITLTNGTMTSLPMSQIDLVATERHNQAGFGSATVIEGIHDPTPTPTPTPQPRLGSLATLARQATPTPANRTPTPTPTPAIQLRTEAYPDELLIKAISEFFDERDLYLFRTSIGTQPDHLYIQVVTDSQREVFHALKVVAEAYQLVCTLQPEKAPSLIELEMLTSVNQPAGTFRMTKEAADRLSAGAITPEEYYVENVIF